MTARKPSSDEQFDGIVHGKERELQERFDNHGFRIIDADSVDEHGEEGDNGEEEESL